MRVQVQVDWTRQLRKRWKLRGSGASMPGQRLARQCLPEWDLVSSTPLTKGENKLHIHQHAETGSKKIIMQAY